MLLRQAFASRSPTCRSAGAPPQIQASLLAPEREDLAHVRQQGASSCGLPSRDAVKGAAVIVERSLILPEEVVGRSQIGQRLRLARAVAGGMP